MIDSQQDRHVEMGGGFSSSQGVGSVKVNIIDPCAIGMELADCQEGGSVKVKKLMHAL